MVHRPADSRLLTNLLQQEKEYSKQLNQLLDSSCASLASLAAYASASPPPVSHVIMELTGSLAAADAAMKRYSIGVDEWRETMRTLKDAEDEVGNIMRDREILVTRLIKVSKSQKSGAGAIRESLLLGHQRFPSSSSLSLSVSGHLESPSPSPSRPLSASFSTSTKLAAAQSELQACEAHLATKERELAQKRCAAVRDGLGIRIRAMVDCGWLWNELGKEALQSLDGLRTEPSDHPLDYNPNGKSPVPPEPDSTRPSSDFSTIGPSQSVSRVNSAHTIPPPVSMAAIMSSGAFGDLTGNNNNDTNGNGNDNDNANTAQTDYNSQRPPSGSSATGSSISKLAAPATYKIETVTYAPAVPVYISGKDSAPTAAREAYKSDYTSMHIPPPHAIEGYTYGFPTASSAIAGPSGLGSPSTSGYSTPQEAPSATPQRQLSTTSPALISDFHRMHTLERRITEEEIRRKSLPASGNVDDASSTEEMEQDEKLVQEGKFSVVENPRFMTERRKKEIEKENERARREKEERARKEKGKLREVDVDNEGLEESEHAGKEKKHFLFFHHPKETSLTKRAGYPPPLSTENESEEHIPSSKTGKSPNTSPSKGFFGGIKSLFSPRQIPSDSKSGPSSSRPGQHDMDDDHDVYHSDNDHSPTKKSNKRRGLFHLRGDTGSKAGGGSGRWETRTDKNLREIARTSSYDDGELRRTIDNGLGTGIGGRAVASVGLGTPTGMGGGMAKGRAASDLGASTSSLQRVPTAPGSVAGGRGRKLKKRGPPVSASAAVAADDLVQNGDAVRSAPLSKPPSETSTPSRTTSTPTKPKASSRRSASVDVPTENRRSWVDQEDENGGMIVDLGRRRTASEVGGTNARQASLAATATATRRPLKSAIRSPPPPSNAAGPAVSPPTKGYSSATAALVPSEPAMGRNKSLTKKRPQATESTVSTSFLPLPIPLIPAVAAPGPTASSTPRSKISVKSAPSTSTVAKKTMSSLPNGNGGATVIAAGGDHPSGTLVSEPGWTAQSQTRGGGLSRNSSSVSSASAPSGGLVGGRKQTVLGQGMGGSGGVARRSSLAATSGGSSAKAISSNAPVHHPKPVGGSLIEPLPPATSLMSIVEDVARVNREGWNHDLKMKKSVGGSQKPTGMIDVVRAPPAMGRKFLEALDADEMASRPFTASTTVPAAATTPIAARTGMFQIKAPGSVFDQPDRQVEPTPKQSVPPSTSFQKHPPPQQHSGPPSSGKAPLRSALRTSRSPSPVAGPSRLPQQQNRGRQIQSATANTLDLLSLPAPVDGILPWGSDGTLQQPRKVDKGKAPMRGPPLPDGNQSGDDSVSTYATGDEMRDSDGEDKLPSVQPAAKLFTRQVAGPPPVMNGHAAGYSSEVSHVSQVSRSTASTVVGPSGQHKSQSQTHPPLQVATQGPRRRKSVRVSLQPTFSPSPPAIEYDDEEEEQRRRAPWAWQGDHSMDSVRQSTPLPAPTPVRAKPAPTITPNGSSAMNDMWADSDDEDEQYARAKRLLSRAAMKERDVTLMVANRA